MKEIFIVGSESEGKRLDVFLSDNLTDITRSQIKKSIEVGLTRVNEKESKAGKLLKSGDSVEFEELEQITDVTPEDIPLNIVYEDDDLAVINKQQGLTVHPAPGNYSGTMVNALLFHFSNMSDIGGNIRPGIVHRIDKDTSGLIVVAKNNKAHLELARQIANKTCRRTYYALLEGIVKESSGVVDMPIGRSLKDRKKMAVIESGKRAVTHYQVVEYFDNYTLMRFDLETGRTHQIRVHSLYLGHPIVGDKAYGYKNQKFALNGQLLHAKEIEFVHPSTAKKMVFEVDLPDYFKDVIGRLRKINYD